jgi:hypothetical protein
MKFSQRIGKTPKRQSIQIESIDSDLANGLWNNILNDFFDKIDDYVSHGRETPKATICKFIWTEFFKNRTDEISSYTTGNVYTAGFIEFLKKWFFIAK